MIHYRTSKKKVLSLFKTHCQLNTVKLPTEYSHCIFQYSLIPWINCIVYCDRMKVTLCSHHGRKEEIGLGNMIPSHRCHFLAFLTEISKGNRGVQAATSFIFVHEQRELFLSAWWENPSVPLWSLTVRDGVGWRGKCRLVKFFLLLGTQGWTQPFPSLCDYDWQSPTEENMVFLEITSLRTTGFLLSCTSTALAQTMMGNTLPFPPTDQKWRGNQCWSSGSISVFTGYNIYILPEMAPFTQLNVIYRYINIHCYLVSSEPHQYLYLQGISNNSW